MPAKSKQQAPLTYRDSGVDIDAGNALVDAIGPLAAKTKRAGLMGGIGGFGGLFDLKACGFKDPVLVAATDGVGTKLKLAIETGFHDGIGIDLVAMNVNDLIVQGAEPLFFLDYFATGKLDVGVATKVVGSIAEGCKEAGCALIGGETAEMPGLYAAGDYDLAGFAVGAVERDGLLPRKDIEPGDVILALPSSGVHANGFSLVRRVVEKSGLRLSDAAPFAPRKTLGQALLTPTRIYVRQILETIRTTRRRQSPGAYHRRRSHREYSRACSLSISQLQIDLGSFVLPPVFAWLKQEANLDDAEMLRTFNCGIGMIVVVGAKDAARVLASLGAEASQIGNIVARDAGSAMRFQGRLEPAGRN